MKKLILTLAILAYSFSNAQASNNPKLEEVNGKVKATYYYDNGTVQQEGFFKDGKLDGKWISYDLKGNIVATAEYSDGKKTGKWLLKSDNDLNNKEVTYQENVIIDVKNTKSNAIVVKD